jgi:hypothetical protein
VTAVVSMSGASLVDFWVAMDLDSSFDAFFRGLPLPRPLRETGALTILAPDWWSRGARSFGCLVAISNARRQTYPARKANPELTYE